MYLNVVQLSFCAASWFASFGLSLCSSTSYAWLEVYRFVDLPSQSPTENEQPLLDQDSHVTSRVRGRVVSRAEPISNAQLARRFPCPLHYPSSGLALDPEACEHWLRTLLFAIQNAAASSSKPLSRKRITSGIKLSGLEMAPSTKCRIAKAKFGEENPKRIVSSQSGKCSEYVRKDSPHCDITISAPQRTKLREARDALRREIEEIEEEEVELLQQQYTLLNELTTRQMKKMRLRKQLRLSESRTDAAVAQGLKDLETAEAVEQIFLPSEERFGVEAAEESHSVPKIPLASWDDTQQRPPDAKDACAATSSANPIPLVQSTSFCGSPL